MFSNQKKINVCFVVKILSEGNDTKLEHDDEWHFCIIE